MPDLDPLVPDVPALRSRLDAVGYLADDALATALFLAVRMGQPILLEGEPGVGKTEAAKALAAALDTPLIRLQCYEGLTSAEALYEWNYPRQLLAIRLAESRGEPLRDADLFGRGLPAAAAAARRDRPPGTAPGGAAHRRGGPGRRRVRGVPVRAAGRGLGDHPRAGHPHGRGAAGRDPDLQPHPRPARRAQAPLPLPLDRLPGHRTGSPRSSAGGCRPSSECAGRAGRRGGGAPACAAGPHQAARRRRGDQLGGARCTRSGLSVWTPTPPTAPWARCSSTPRTWSRAAGPDWRSWSSAEAGSDA